MDHRSPPRFSRIDMDKLQALDTLVKWGDVNHFRSCEAYNEQLNALDRLFITHPDIALQGPSEDMTYADIVNRLALLSLARSLPNVPYILKRPPNQGGNYDIVRPTIPPAEIKELDALRDAFCGLYMAYYEAFTERRQAAEAAGEYYLMLPPRPAPAKKPSCEDAEYTWP